MSCTISYTEKVKTHTLKCGREDWYLPIHHHWKERTSYQEGYQHSGIRDPRAVQQEVGRWLSSQGKVLCWHDKKQYSLGAVST